MKRNFITIILIALVVLHLIDGWPNGALGWINIALLAVCLILNLIVERKSRHETTRDQA